MNYLEDELMKLVKIIANVSGVSVYLGSIMYLNNSKYKTEEYLIFKVSGNKKKGQIAANTTIPIMPRRDQYVTLPNSFYDNKYILERQYNGKHIF